MIDWHNLTGPQVAFLSLFATLLVAVMSGVSAYVATMAKAKADEASTVRREYREYLRSEYLPFLKYAAERPRLAAQLAAMAHSLSDVPDANDHFRKLAVQWFSSAAPVDASLTSIMRDSPSFEEAARAFSKVEGDTSEMLRKWSETGLTPQMGNSFEELMKRYMDSSANIRASLEAVIYPPKHR